MELIRGGAAFNETISLAIGVGSSDGHPTNENWRDLEPRLQATEYPPPDAIRLMNEIRRSNDVFAQTSALSQLLSLHSSYVKPGPITRVTRLFLRKRPHRAPVWLREFLIERISVSNHRQTASLTNGAYTALYGEPPRPEEVAIKKVLMATIWPAKERAVRELITNHGSSGTVQTLLRALALQDSDEHVRSAAIAGIEPLSEDWAPFKDFMLKIYGATENERERAAVMRQLARLRRTDGEVMTMLVTAALDMEHPLVRGEAVLALEEFVGESTQAAKLVGKSLFGPSDRGQLAAISVVERLFAASTTDLKSLLYEVYHSTQSVIGKFYAISAIDRSVPADETLYQTLMNEVEAFDPKDAILRAQALKILTARYIDRAAVTEALKRYANADDHYSHVRRVALQSIGQFYTRDESIRDLIHERCWKESDESTQAIALEIVAFHCQEGDAKSIAVLKKAYAERPEGFSWASRASKIVALPD